MEENKSDELWGPVNPDNWKTVSFIKDRIAAEEDIQFGKAVFVVDSQGQEHNPMNVPIPSLAYHIDQDTSEKTLVVIIQAEVVGNQQLVGMRYMNGGNGVCLLYELEIIEE